VRNAFDINETVSAPADDGFMSSRARERQEAKDAAQDEKLSARDQREEDRRRIRNEKRELRDLRYIAANHIIPPADAEGFWADLKKLQLEHGKEGVTEFWWNVVPKLEQAQLTRGGGLCPSHLKPPGAPSLTETHKRVAAALERASRNVRTLEASQVLQGWAMEDGTL
jgi:hypothetical protein